LIYNEPREILFEVSRFLKEKCRYWFYSEYREMDRQIRWNWKMEWEILELFYLIAIERNEIVFF
jgi:hypothetical protein